MSTPTDPTMRDETPPDSQAQVPDPPTIDGGVADRVARRLFDDTEPEATRVGRFRILCRIGIGGMGEVYLGYDPQLDRNVALKRLRKIEPKGRERLEREARALAKLQHPNVVAVHDLLEIGDELHVEMEYVDGTTLAHWQNGRGWQEVLAAYIQAGRGLEAAHGVGMLHRDFKPSNVLVGSDRRVRVADFGIAVLVTADEHDTSHLYGTREYLAPELFGGQPASPKSDQFSFCVALWEGVTGRRPFSPEALALAGAHGAELTPPVDFEGPRWLRRVLQRGLRAEAEKRWPTMGSLLEALERGPRVRRSLLTMVMVATVLVGGVTLDPSPACPTADPSWTPAQWIRFARLATTDHDALTTLRSAVALLSDQDARLERERDRICVANDRRDSYEVCLDHQSAFSIGVREAIASERGLEDAPLLLESLPDPATCRLAPEHRIDPTPRLALLRTSLRRGWLAQARGLPGEAATLADMVLTTEQSLPSSLRVESRFLRARAKRRLGLVAEARRDLTAILSEIELGSSPARFAAARELAEIEIFEGENEGAAELPLELARTTLESLGEIPSLEVDYLLTRAELERRSDPELALASLERARSLEIGLNPAKQAGLHMRIANAHADAGHYDEATRGYESLLGEFERLFGPTHPTLATLELNLGITLANQARNAEALQHVEHAIAIESRALGMASPTLAPMLVQAAALQVELGRCDVAKELATRALKLRGEHVKPEHSEYFDPLRVLANVHLCQGRYVELDATYGLMLDPLPSDVEERDTLLQTAAWAACRVGNFERARALIAQVSPLPIPELAPRIEEVWVEIELHEGDLRGGAERLRAARSRLSAPDPELEAELAWLEARLRAEGSPEK